MSVDKKVHPFTRESFEELMRSRFFYTQSFEIYGGQSNRFSHLALSAPKPGKLRPLWPLLHFPSAGVAGFYDYGPPGMHIL